MNIFICSMVNITLRIKNGVIFFYRYLRVFPQMRLVTRCKKEKTLDKNRVELNIEEIDYVPLPFFQGPKQYALKYFEIGKILNSTIIGCDCAILRLPFIISERLGKISNKEKTNICS